MLNVAVDIANNTTTAAAICALFRCIRCCNATAAVVDCGVAATAASYCCSCYYYCCYCYCSNRFSIFCSCCCCYCDCCFYSACVWNIWVKYKSITIHHFIMYYFKFVILIVFVIVIIRIFVGITRILKIVIFIIGMICTYARLIKHFISNVIFSY